MELPLAWLSPNKLGGSPGKQHKVTYISLAWAGGGRWAGGKGWARFGGVLGVQSSPYYSSDPSEKQHEATHLGAATTGGCGLPRGTNLPLLNKVSISPSQN